MCTDFAQDKLCNLPQHGGKFQEEDRTGNQMIDLGSKD